MKGLESSFLGGEMVCLESLEALGANTSWTIALLDGGVLPRMEVESDSEIMFSPRYPSFTGSQAVGMTMCPRVTIGVSVYNGSRFLAETLQSLLSQTFDNFGLLISAGRSALADASRRVSRVPYLR
jgi:hypothetical protein